VVSQLRYTSISVVLFDVGGVLVEPSGVATMLARMDNRLSAEECLTSPTVRSFETGKQSAEEFLGEAHDARGIPAVLLRFLGAS
jgi:hypothetical protein